MDRSTVQKITIGFGVVYLLVGILGFIPGITTANTDYSGVPGEGLIMGIFPVNLIHNLSHLALAAALILGGMSRNYVGTVNRVLCGVFVILVIAGLIGPLANTLLGAEAVNIPDLLLHLGSALLTGYLGFVAARDTDAYSTGNRLES